MKHLALVCSLAVAVALPAPASVFFNEIYQNPVAQNDSTKEFIELMGTPGKKLDGYGIAHIQGGVTRIYASGSVLTPPQEIDEFFSLEGTELGPNGILVIGVGFDFAGDYPALLADASFRSWNQGAVPPIWNGNLDTNGQLENDGSSTYLLVRNRPGATEADPGNPIGLRWGKDIKHDAELIPVDGMVCQGGLGNGQPCETSLDCFGGVPCVPGTLDQWGDGNVDRGDPNGQSGNTLDLKGAATPLDVSDDLEIVDEISWEHESGWEYDLDDRIVDIDADDPGMFPERSVHALDDPNGINPDCLSRVDYRTKGPGHAPAPGATGQMGNGNNWQDTATEQWVRGESVEGFGGVGGFPQFFYSNLANADPDAIQPFETHVPLWLDDGLGTDYNFTMADTYQIMAGRVNPLAVPYIPGDTDRDGDADQDDIDKLATVFGDDDWVFSNSYEDAPEGDEADPATQTRTWDVDATGDNGVEASDLQWTLNFLGDTTGRIVGVQYDDVVPAAVGVRLNSNAAVQCTVTAASNSLSGRPLSGLRVGDLVEVTVSLAVSAGANMTPGQQNGVMQFVQGLALGTGGVVRVNAIQTLGTYTTTRPAIQTLAGTNGDLGAGRIHGYTTSFTQGLSGAANAYRVTLQAVGLGSTAMDVDPAADVNFAVGTPFGVKVGHTNNNGDPAGATYPGTQSLTVTLARVPGDFDDNGTLELADHGDFRDCMTGPDNGPVGQACVPADFDLDTDVDLADWRQFQIDLP